MSHGTCNEWLRETYRDVETFWLSVRLSDLLSLPLIQIYSSVQRINVTDIYRLAEIYRDVARLTKTYIMYRHRDLQTTENYCRYRDIVIYRDLLWLTYTATSSGLQIQGHGDLLWMRRRGWSCPPFRLPVYQRGGTSRPPLPRSGPWQGC